MRRLALAVALLAAVGVAASSGTYAEFSQTRANTAPLTTATSFLPVNTVLPAVTGSLTLGVLGGSVSLASAGTWAYDHVGGQNVDTSGEPAIGTIADRWEVLLLGNWVDEGPAATPLTITAGILGATGVRIKETATTALGTTDPVYKVVS